MYSSLQYSS